MRRFFILTFDNPEIPAKDTKKATPERGVALAAVPEVVAAAEEGKVYSEGRSRHTPGETPVCQPVEDLHERRDRSTTGEGVHQGI